MRAKFSARTGWQRPKGQRSVCSARLYEASLGRHGALLRPLRSIGRLCLTYAVCNDTALVSAYFARSLRAFACPLRSGTGCAPDNGGRATAVV